MKNKKSTTTKMPRIKLLVNKAKEIYPGKDSFFDPNGTDDKHHQKILIGAMHWAFKLGMEATIDIYKASPKLKK